MNDSIKIFKNVDKLSRISRKKHKEMKRSLETGITIEDHCRRIIILGSRKFSLRAHGTSARLSRIPTETKGVRRKKKKREAIFCHLSSQFYRAHRAYDVKLAIY